MGDSYEQPGAKVGHARYIAILDAAIDRAKRGKAADRMRQGETYADWRERLGLPVTRRGAA